MIFSAPALDGTASQWRTVIHIWHPHVQLIQPIDDMKPFDGEDAQLNLAHGTPRFYIMRLPKKSQGLAFSQITHHKHVTQCLGSLTPGDWCAHGHRKLN